MTTATVPRISCIICTYRNPDLLRDALQSLAEQDLPRQDYEVIVVDNNSRDATESVTREFMTAADSNVSYVLEPRQGLAYARNTGLEHARADIIAFTDDDAVATPGWLSALLAVYDTNPDAWAAGGPVEGLWKVERPDWLTDDMLLNLSLRTWGDERRPLVWPERLIGVNSSFRRIAFDEIGQFTGGLGRKGRLLLGHEDTEIQERIHAIGRQVIYSPAALVYHVVPPERVTRQYFARRFYGAGRSLLLVELGQKDRAAIRTSARERLTVVIRNLMPLRYARGGRVPIRRRSYRGLWMRISSNIGYLHQYVRTIWFGLDKPDSAQS